MAIYNSLAHGQRSAVWCSLGNASGLFCLSAAAMLGQGGVAAPVPDPHLNLHGVVGNILESVCRTFRAKGVLTRPDLSRWVSRVVGSTFICFGAAILTMRRQTT
jgi:threonine/homoserine/homoserine lactone efflux protein